MKASYETMPVFGLAIPKSIPNVPCELLNPAKTWKQGPDAFKKELERLGQLFQTNFKKFSKDNAAAKALEKANLNF